MCEYVDKKLIIGALALSSLWATPALAQPVSDNTGTARIDIRVPLAMLKVDDLDLGTVAISSTLSGSVTTPSDGSARVFAGGASGVASDVGQRAEFLVVGDPGREIIVTHVAPTFLTSLAGDQILMLGMQLDGAPIKTLDAVTGQATLFFGGSIFLNADQPEGVYEANFTVTVDYR